MFDASSLEHLACIGKVDARRRKLVAERLNRVLLRHDLNVVLVLSLEADKNRFEEGVKSVKHLMVVLLERHFEIETNKLSHVARRVAVFSTKNLQ